MNEELGSDGRAQHPRFDPEKRRLQNRESQRTFREKQKKIKESLKQASRSRRSDPRGPRRTLQPKEAAVEPGDACDVEIGNIASQDSVEISNNEEALTQALSTRSGEGAGSWFSVADLDINLLDEFPMTTQPLDSSWSTNALDATLVTPASTQLMNTRQSFPDLPFFDSASYFDNMSSIPVSSSASLDSTPYSPATMNIMGDITTAHTGTLNLLQVPDTIEHRSLLANALQQHHSIGSIFLAGLRSVSNPVLASERLPDLHSNHLSLRQLSTMQAYLSNAHALLFDVPSLMHPFAASPFHQTHISEVASAKAYISTLPEALPLHLRPTSAQILHAHLPFLDLLPFPTLRERAITLASITPPLIDLRELKADILNDGLVCWGGTNRGGQPWDMRTWEAARWFLTKWWILVGAESEEVREGARWWRRLRGEETATRFAEEV